MSGAGGGYYKYRYKYWLTYSCSNWVWVNNAKCANCLVCQSTAVSRWMLISNSHVEEMRWESTVPIQDVEGDICTTIWRRKFVLYTDGDCRLKRFWLQLGCAGTSKRWVSKINRAEGGKCGGACWDYGWNTHEASSCDNQGGLRSNTTKLDSLSFHVAFSWGLFYLFCLGNKSMVCFLSPIFGGGQWNWKNWKWNDESFCKSDAKFWFATLSHSSSRVVQ